MAKTTTAKKTVKDYGFDHLDNLFTKKYKWSELKPEHKKTFNLFMLNKFLSTIPDYIELVNELQILSKALNKEETYTLYYNVLPQLNYTPRVTYIRGVTENKWEDELVKIISNYFKCNLSHSKEYLDTYEKTNTFEVVKDILKMYGKTEKEILKLIKIK